MNKALDELNIKIVSELRREGRMPNTEIAKKLNLSESTVRKRIHRMIEQDLIRPIVLVNHSILGYKVEAAIAIQTEPSKLKEVAKSIAELSEVRFVCIAAGEYNIAAQARFKTNEEFSEFLTEKIGQLDGITRIQTSLILNIVKYAYEWSPLLEESLN
ncbi:Lrp/AsnC family transcriptional regulator [Chloroflexota bacterium]